MMIHALVEALPWLAQNPPPQPFGCPPPPPSGPPPTCAIPNPAPIEPTLPGFDRILQLVSNIRWIASLSLVAIFFVGVIVWSAGRGVDHHRAGRVGTVMMLVGVLGALVWSLGPALISYMAGQ